MLAKIESLKAGYAEAILLDDHGYVCEGSGENIYILRDGVVFTPRSPLDPRRDQPPLAVPDRPGPRLPLVERDIARAKLYLADEVFLSGTAGRAGTGREIDDHPIAGGGPGPTTTALQAAFDDALHGRGERYRDWLDIVEPA